MTEAIIISVIWTGENMAKIPRFFNKFIEGIGEYEEVMIVHIKYSPINLFELLSEDYWGRLSVIGYMQRDLEETQETFDELLDAMHNHELGAYFIEGSENGPVLATDFKRNYVYHRCFRLVFVKEMRISINPFFKWKSGSQCIYVNNEKLDSYNELKTEIVEWFRKIKEKTDQSNI